MLNAENQETEDSNEPGESSAETFFSAWREKKFRHVICMLKHSDMKMHAVWLANRLNPKCDVFEAKKWVESVSERLPIASPKELIGWKMGDCIGCGERDGDPYCETCMEGLIKQHEEWMKQNVKSSSDSQPDNES